MNLIEYFKPIQLKKDLIPLPHSYDSLYSKVSVYQKDFPSLSGKRLAIIGIETPQFKNEANFIRSYLYSFTNQKYTEKLVDLGNYIFDSSDPKSYEKLAYLLSELTEKQIIPLIIGPTQEITYSQYLAFEYIKHIINIVSIDSKIDFAKDVKGHYNKDSYWYRILMQDPSYLFNLSHLAYQTYLTDTETLKLMEDHYFDLHRLGKVRDDISDIEPVIRTADMVTFDISAIRQPDAPANNHPTPNGLYTDEACQLARYCGLSDNLISIGFYEYNSGLDNNYQTAQLIAQMIWYFLDGMVHRDTEPIIGDEMLFTKYITTDHNQNYQMIFYKSKKTNRWWMEVPGSSKSNNLKSKQIIPCSYKDYQAATSGDIPERWWKALKKLS